MKEAINLSQLQTDTTVSNKHQSISKLCRKIYKFHLYSNKMPSLRRRIKTPSLKTILFCLINFASIFQIFNAKIMLIIFNMFIKLSRMSQLYFDKHQICKSDMKVHSFNKTSHDIKIQSSSSSILLLPI